MLNQETRNQIKEMIKNIKWYEKKMDKLAKEDFDGTCKEFDAIWESVVDNLNRELESFEEETACIFVRNLDLKIQKSINYYRGLIGFPKFTITAIM